MDSPSLKWLRVLRHSRRPVSRGRWWLGAVTLLLVAAGVSAYYVLTNEARLRRFAEHWLAEFSGGQVFIEQVRFDIFHGLHLVGVTLALPPGTNFDQHDDSPAERTIFHSSTLFLRLRPLSIVTGNLAVPEIVAVNPEITLVHRLPDGLGNWELMFRQRIKRRPSRATQLPLIRLRNVRLRQYRLDERGRSGGAAQVIWADAQPVQDRPQVYDLKITKFLPRSDTQKVSGETGRLEIDMHTLAVAGSLPTMSIDELLFTASPQINRWLDILDLHGYVRPETFAFNPQTDPRATLMLRGARLSLPIDAQERENPRQRYLQFTALAGTIRFDGGAASVELAGRFRDGPIAIRGKMVLAENDLAGLEALGFDLELSLEKVLLPRHDQRAEESEGRFVRHWERLREFLKNYDAAGAVDVYFTLHKEPGPGHGVELLDGKLIARGASCSYWRFPYQVRAVTGTVHFRRDGSIVLEHLSGTHGKGRVTANGWVSGWSQDNPCKLVLTGENIELDDDLRRCLAPGDQELCRLFDARARMNLLVHLERKPAPPKASGNPWTTAMEVEFIDGAIRFAGFPYPLTGLKGRMRIDGGGFEIAELRAGRSTAEVSLKGTARRAEGPFGLNLELRGTNIPLDDTLAAALPAAARQMYNRFSPSGHTDLSGRIFTTEDRPGIQYDLRASLQEGQWSFPGCQARLTDTAGVIHVVPGQLEIESAKARFGESALTLQGRLVLDRPEFTLKLRSDRLLLDERMYAALPEALRGIWEQIKPSGPIALDLHCRRAPATQPAEASVPALDYQAVIEPLDARAVYAGFPLLLEQIRGRLVVTPAKVAIERLTARHEQASITIAGEVDLAAADQPVRLTLEAAGLTFTEALRQAVPWRIRRTWNDVQPRGVIDLHLDTLSFSIRPGQSAALIMAGRAELHDCALSIGAELTEMNGPIRGRVELGPQLTMQGDLHLPRLRVDGRLLTEATAKLARPPGSSVFRLQDLKGSFYDGALMGEAEVDFASVPPQYGLSLSSRSISLQQFLNANRKPEEKPIELKGQVQGNLALTGRFGEPPSRRGGGGIFIAQAQMCKVPLMLAILQIINFAIDDDNAFHDASMTFVIDGDDLILNEIDLRGKALSMIGAGRVHIPNQELDLTMLVGSPLRLPRIEVLTELMEGVARELMEVHVEGTLEQPTFRAEMVRSVKKTLQTILNARRIGENTNPGTTHEGKGKR